MSSSPSLANQSFSELVDNGLCIGCGICTLASAKIQVSMNESGYYRASIKEHLSEIENQNALNVCPFSNSSLNEDELSAFFHGGISNHAPIVSYYISCNILSVKDERIRLRSTSSGFTTWLLIALLENKLVDGIIHVASQVEDGQDILFKYSISKDSREVYLKSKTRYYPVELSEVFSSIVDDGLKYAIVGLPCFIKSVQNLRFRDNKWRHKIVFTLGLFCGHLKSALFTSNIIDVARVKRSSVLNFDFRAKSPKWSAANYISQIQSKTETSLVDLNAVPGGTWATGGFKYFACNFCDDILGETSDVSIGDAWMEPYKHDWKGTNNVIIRNRQIQDLVDSAVQSGQIDLVEVSPEYSTYGAAAGGIADRRDGLSYRLQLMDDLGQGRPTKRLGPDSQMSNKRKELIALKMFNGMFTSYLYVLSKKVGFRALYTIPVYIVETYYKFVRRFGFPVGLFGCALRAILRLRLIPR